MSIVRGVRVFARVKRCGNGFNTFEGIEWLMDGVKFVGGSHLREWSAGALEEDKDEITPYAHEENLVSIHRGILLVPEDVREPEQAPSVARRALRKYDDRAMCSFPHLFQALVFLLFVGGWGGDPPGVGYHGPKRDDFETEHSCVGD